MTEARTENESSSSDESMINQLQELQKKVADMEKGLEEGFKKEQKLAKQLETQVQISEDFQAQMKAKDQQLLDYVNRLQKFENIRKSSMDNKPPNCECVNTGFQHCVLYPKEFCKCSASCTFVNDFFQGGKDDDDAEIISMRTFSGLISPIPDADLEEEQGKSSATPTSASTNTRKSRRNKSKEDKSGKSKVEAISTYKGPGKSSKLPLESDPLGLGL